MNPASIGGCTGGTTVFVERSTDHGATWSAPVQVSNSANDGYVWPSTVKVAPDGEVFVAYHAQPNDGNRVAANDHTADRVTVVGFRNDLSGSPLSNSTALPNARIRGAYPNSQGINNNTIGVGQAWVIPDPARPGLL